jgi:hypothetical protein
LRLIWSNRLRIRQKIDLGITDESVFGKNKLPQCQTASHSFRNQEFAVRKKGVEKSRTLAYPRQKQQRLEIVAGS